MQSKDADPEKFFGKLKERMQRCACVLDVTSTVSVISEKHLACPWAQNIARDACAGLVLTLPV